MKLFNKILIITGLTWTVFFALTAINAVRSSYFVFLSLGLLFFGLSAFLIHTLALRNLEKLTERVINMESTPTTDDELPPFKNEIAPTENDEVKIISEKLNHFVNLIQHSNETLKKKIDESSIELQNNNLQLQQEIVERMSLERKLSTTKSYLNEIARSDELTSLPNRVVFNGILNKAISHAKRRKQILAILLINIDSFKIFHETLGSEKGDYILKELGKRFSQVLRAEDILAKLDGDEYIILLTDINKAKFASTVAEKILKACTQPLLVGSRDYFLTASIGIAIYPNDGESLQDLLSHVGLALFKAKHKGKGNYQFYTQEMDAEAREYKQLESALKEAIATDQLALYYQPKIEIKTGNIVGIEALIRWEHPEYGIIPPSVFIPLVEETGTIMQVGEWALRKACQTNKEWENEGYEHLTVSINLSPKQFYHEKMPGIIADILKETELNPNYLELEITEKTVMDDTKTSIEILKKLKEIGVQLSLDHFGTGYTSISHIKQFPISILKIDPNFIKGIPTTPDDNAIVSALIGLAHNLGLKIVAQGVEKAEQVQYLASQHCDMIQGYFLSHPLPAKTIMLQFKKLGDKVLL